MGDSKNQQQQPKKTMLRLKPSNVTVPDQFRFICPEDAHEIKAYGKEDWFAKIKTHYVNNGYVLPENWKEKAEDQLCRTLSGGMVRRRKTRVLH
jgi:hypothetical protein